MKRSMITTIALCLFAFVAATGLAQAQTPQAENLAAWQKQVILELRTLKLETAQMELEFRAWKIKQLERELQQVRNEKERLQEQEQALDQGITELEKLLANPTPSNAEQTREFEAIKADLTEKSLKNLRATRQSVTEREAELTEQLEQEQERSRKLLQKAGKLRAEAGGTIE